MDIFNFQKRIDELASFKEENGHYDIPSNYKPNPSLGNYIYRLKTKGVKEEWKVRMLNDIGFYDIGTQEKKEKQGHVTTYWYQMLEELKKVPNPNLKKDDKDFPELA